MTKPTRAHTLILSAGGDTADDLACELRSLATALERGELTEGTAGSPSHGSIYSYKRREVSHAQYFAELEAWLARRKA
ncbi:hypothetical protein [Salinarimonas rosea]|uniref:hypothetical protein n=1 Tax=Salinarimonas rosea TaxID=552063 RepID=UPI00040EBA77|nr:hypothetical protein [Salinarimonas rosea]